MADHAPATAAPPGQQTAPRNEPSGGKAPLRDRLTGIALASPATALMLALLIGPTLAVGFLSLTDWGFGARSFAFIGLDNYAEMTGDPVFRRSLINTLVYVGVGSCREGGGNLKAACGFRFNPATDSDLKPASHSGTKPATIPI